MKTILIAIYSAATVTSLLGTVFMLVSTYPNYDPDFITATLIALAVFLIIGLLFSGILLSILAPIYKSISPKFSLSLFIVIGFGVPFSLGYFASSLGVRGNPSSLEADWNSAMSLILIYSLIGAISAFVGWIVLRRESTSVHT